MKILGRQFQYDRALQIIQEEEYLEDSDFDDIKRYDILKKIGKSDVDFNIPEKQQHSKWTQQNERQNYSYSGKYSKHHNEYAQRQM